MKKKILTFALATCMLIPFSFTLSGCFGGGDDNGGSNHTHDYTVSKYNDNQHWLECACGDKSELANHTFDDDCDPTCNYCDYDRSAPHSYASTWSSDDTNHWHQCSGCDDIKDQAEHTIDNVWHYDDKTGHYHKCTICDKHSTLEEHNYDDDCDDTCNDCGYERTAPHSYPSTWSSNETKHWHECSLCHIHDADVTHSYVVKNYNNTQHWLECECGSVDETTRKAHTYEDGVCSDCGNVEKMVYSYDSTTQTYSVTDGKDITATAITIPSIYDDGTHGTHPVTSIGSNAFKGCTSLTSVTIPASITSIGSNAFLGCTNLTKVNYLGTIDQWAQISFSDLTSNPTYYAKALYINDQLVTEINLTTATKISDYAFYNCKNITSATIPDSVTSIGDFAFYICTSLTKVNYLGTIDQWAEIDFGNYGSNPTRYTKALYINDQLVTEVNLTTATEISSYAFYNCTSLTSVTIGNGVTSISYAAFTGCTSLAKVNYLGTIDQWVQISFGNSWSDKKALYINNQLVTEVNLTTATKISSEAFAYCENITSVIISDNVTSIGSGAFSHCTSLTSVTIGNSVTSIGSFAFNNCANLTSVTIGNSVTSIGSAAFTGCYKLAEVYNLSSLSLSKGSSNYGDVAYYAKNIYTSVSVESKSSIDANGYVIYTDGDNKILLGYTGTETELTLPSDITEINKYAFYNCTSLTNMTIPDSVTSIGDYAFYNCTSLTNMTIPDSVTSIGSDAFGNCGNLTSVTIGNGVTSIGGHAFYRCTGLTSVIIPNSVTSIGDDAFSGCTGLTSVTIGNGVTSIGSWAFYMCSGLTSITIPDSVTSIGSDAFLGCSSLTKVNYLGTIDKWAQINFCSKQYDVYVGTSNPTYYAKALYINDQLVTQVNLTTAIKISNYAFINCTSLTSVTIGNSVTSIGSGAFSGCTSFTKVNYLGTIDQWVQISFSGKWLDAKALYINDQLVTEVNLTTATKISNYAFCGYTSLTSVTIGNSVTSIGDYAFKDCTSLTSVTIPDSVTSTGDFAFSGCTSLTNITIPDSVTSIGGYAFYRCTGLTSVIIPNSITSIGDYAFYDCSNLTSVTIGNSVTRIYYSAFSGCTSLTSVYYQGTASGWKHIYISSYNSNLTSATRYYYIENESDVPTDGGNYWHYDTDGKTPVAWQIGTTEEE